MDGKAKKRLEVIRQKMLLLKQRLAGAKKQDDEPGEIRKLEQEIAQLEAEATKLRDLFELVGPFDACEVLIDDRPVPYARELWLPLIWFLIPR